jgi:hypothetical protein
VLAHETTERSQTRAPSLPLARKTTEFVLLLRTSHSRPRQRSLLQNRRETRIRVAFSCPPKEKAATYNDAEPLSHT